MERVKDERKRVQDRLKRLGKAFVDGIFDEVDYQRQEQQLQPALESLVVPEADGTEEAGNLIQQLPQLWVAANSAEQRQILLSLLAGIYGDAKEEKRIVALKSRSAFQSLFRITTTKSFRLVVFTTKIPSIKRGLPLFVFLVETGEQLC